MKQFVLVAVLGIFGMSLAQAQTTYKCPEDNPNFSITFPEGWKEKQKSDGFVEMESPDGSIWLDVWTIKDRDPNSNSFDDIKDDMKSWLTDVDLERNEKGDFKINGISFIELLGTAKLKDGGDPQEIAAHLCSIDGKSTIVIMYYGDKGAGDKNAADLRFISNSIKPLSE